MSKTISQDTFNASVKENMDLFDMPLDEAIAEAKQQFVAMGVNLYNIVSDNSIFCAENNDMLLSLHPVVQLLKSIKAQISESSEMDFEIMEKSLDSLKSYFSSDIAYRLMASDNGGQEILESVLKRAVELEVKNGIDCCLLTFCNYLTGQPDVANEKFFGYLTSLVKSESLGKHSTAMIFRILFHCCYKHEPNRQILINEPNCIIPLAVDQLDKYGDKSKQLTKDICSFLRSLILDDDIRVTFGRGMENAKTIVTETNCLDVLLRLCKEYKEQDAESVVAELFYSLDKLSVRNEFCQRILDLGGVDYILEALGNHNASQRIVTSSFAVLKSLSANDKVKQEIGKKNGLGLMLRSLEIHIHNRSSCVNGFGALSAVSLRTETNSRELVKMGLPQLLRQGIQIHSELRHFDVLRPICLTTRNVVARCPELKVDMLEAGLEEWLNIVLRLGRDCDDEAKAALRDLGCRVELREPWTGKMGVKVQQS